MDSKQPTDDSVREYAQKYCKRVQDEPADLQVDDDAQVLHGDEEYSWVRAWVAVKWDKITPAR